MPVRPDDAALVVGTGGLLSMADVLPPTIYMTDMDTYLHEWMAKAVDAIGRSETPREYKSITRACGLWFQREHDLFADKYFLASQERFESARSAVAGKAITYVAMDYALQADVASLAVLMNRERIHIRVFNATNMHRHIEGGSKDLLGGYLESLKRLPWSDDVRILSSAVELIAPRSLPVQSSLEGYVHIAQAEHPHKKEVLPRSRRSFFRR